ncbi:sialate O-acetylesterase [Dysgonomonas hofstadii]|uniref:Sialate O-acetylesterase n=1 Tax=Dysgonomonas hofstadii TaxID=637886 RepID=A0A840CYZ3_9BACT|nr:sialate O-acetylesterase [Dysgonomonas hofstadii]MBB4037632.1 sialate O-acetylesterase [Dysgonomonas hofstadii]
MKLIKYFIPIILLLQYSLIVKSEIILPSILGDNMVLQQNAEVKLWGWAKKLTDITISTSWDHIVYKTKSSDTGEWAVKVQTPRAGGPYSINISDGDNLIINNILIGEVWLCSGQSNMEMRIEGFRGQPIESSLDVISMASPDNDIRFITIQRASSQIPQNDCVGQWQESNPASVLKVSATAYFFAQYLQKVLNVPVGLICSSWGGSKIQPWINEATYRENFPEISLEALTKNEKEIKDPRYEPALLYNAMINPVLNYVIKGAIWYQGESNRNESDLYKKLFPAMVRSWRKEWALGDFPFYYVQIAPYCYGKDNCENTEAAQLRQVQLECMDIIPNSGMVVTADIGYTTCIHPPKKSEVGKRLALWALAKTYGREGTPHSGPLYSSVDVDGDKIYVNFKHSEYGLTSYYEDIFGFEVAAADKVFYPAKAKLTAKSTKILLTCDKVNDPVYVRYAFRNDAVVNLYNNFRLPVSPFTSE